MLVAVRVSVEPDGFSHPAISEVKDFPPAKYCIMKQRIHSLNFIDFKRYSYNLLDSVTWSTR